MQKVISDFKFKTTYLSTIPLDKYYGFKIDVSVSPFFIPSKHWIFPGNINGGPAYY